MSGEATFTAAARRVWRQRVQGRHMYRGMSREDLSDPLDPAHDPFADMRPRLSALIAVLRRQVARGFRFAVHEDYSSLSFDLADILDWTQGDLDHPGIHFTSIHHSAAGYAHNYRGSQLKQNLKYITDHLADFSDDPVLQAGMTLDDWSLVAEVNEWVCGGPPSGARIVIWVPRTSPVFAGETECLPLGSFDDFLGRVSRALERAGLPFTPQALQGALPPEDREFLAKAQRPLARSDIERIEEIHSAIWRPADTQTEA